MPDWPWQRDERNFMALTIRAIDPVSRPFFAGVVSGIDIAQLLSQWMEQAA
jgi:hypothetical protein